MVVLKVDKVDKSIKQNKEGEEVVTYKCNLKGNDGVVKISMTISSENLETLNMFVPQSVGERRNLELNLLK